MQSRKLGLMDNLFGRTDTSQTLAPASLGPQEMPVPEQ